MKKLMPENERRHPNCTLVADGCNNPKNCGTCGFDKAEQARRAAIPLTPGLRGLYHKNIRMENGEQDHE